MSDTPTLAEVVAALEHWESPDRACLGALLARIPPDAELFDVERLARALQRNQDQTYLDVGSHRYHCGGTCAAAILTAAKEMP